MHVSSFSRREVFTGYDERIVELSKTQPYLLSRWCNPVRRLRVAVASWIWHRLRKYRLWCLGHDIWRVEKLDHCIVASDAQSAAIHGGQRQLDAFCQGCHYSLQSVPHNDRSTQGAIQAKEFKDNGPMSSPNIPSRHDVNLLHPSCLQNKSYYESYSILLPINIENIFGTHIVKFYHKSKGRASMKERRVWKSSLDPLIPSDHGPYKWRHPVSAKRTKFSR